MMLIEVYILVNTSLPDNPVLGVYDTNFLAEKRKSYFTTVYSNDDLIIVKKRLEYSQFE